jgi:hypothetical protein
VIDAPEFVPAPDKDEGNEAGIDGGGAGTGTETQEAGTGGGAG